MPSLFTSSVPSNELWIAIRRFRRDPAARAYIFRIVTVYALLLSPVSLLVAWLTFKLLQIVGFTFVHFAEITGAFLLFFIGPIVLFTAIGQTLRIFLGLVLKAPIRAVARLLRDAHFARMQAVSLEVKRSLHREASIIAILLARLASESYLEKDLPPDLVVTTRRVHLDQLTSLGLRDELDPWMLDLFLAPDGHWTKEQKSRVRSAFECFNVLLWAFGLAELDELTLVPTYDLGAVKSLFAIETPDHLAIPPSWDLRIHRNNTSVFVNRYWSELLARRAVEGGSEADIAHAVQLRSVIMEAGYTGDYLVGAKTVPELDTPLLWFLFVRAHNRWQTLSVLVNVTSGEKPASELRTLFRAFIASPDSPDAPH